MRRSEITRGMVLHAWTSLWGEFLITVKEVIPSKPSRVRGTIIKVLKDGCGFRAGSRSWGVKIIWRHMKKRPQNFRPSWYIYPHAGIALIVFSESELSEQEVQIGKGEFIKQATQDEQSYQTSGILKMVTEYFSIIANAPIETQSSGVAS